MAHQGEDWRKRASANSARDRGVGRRAFARWLHGQAELRMFPRCRAGLKGETMKIRLSAFSIPALLLGVLLAVSPLVFGADTPGKKTTAKNASSKLDQPADASKNSTTP